MGMWAEATYPHGSTLPMIEVLVGELKTINYQVEELNNEAVVDKMIDVRKEGSGKGR